MTVEDLDSGLMRVENMKKFDFIISFNDNIPKMVFRILNNLGTNLKPYI